MSRHRQDHKLTGADQPIDVDAFSYRYAIGMAIACHGGGPGERRLSSWIWQEQSNSHQPGSLGDGVGDRAARRIAPPGHSAQWVGLGLGLGGRETKSRQSVAGDWRERRETVFEQAMRQISPCSITTDPSAPQEGVCFREGGEEGMAGCRESCDQPSSSKASLAVRRLGRHSARTNRPMTSLRHLTMASSGSRA